MAQLPTHLTEVTVFLSSGADMVAERRIVKQVIRDVNADPLWQSRCVLEVLSYEDCVPGDLSVPAAVPDVREADLVVCIFGNRMGTPFEDERMVRFQSGTHYEFDAAYQAFQASGQRRPRILLYLANRDLPPDAGPGEIEHDRRAREFHRRIKSGSGYAGLHFEYREPDEFEVLFRRHLKQQLDVLLAEPPEEPPAAPRPTQDGKVVAISYAHGDDSSDAGRQRSRAVEEVHARLLAWGCTVLRDREQLKNCDLIRDFMLTIGRTRRVLVILSKKYLESVYCMTELFYVYQHSLGEERDFTDRVVPVLLDDVRIDSWRERACWAEYWEREYQEMEKRSRHLGRADLDQLYRIRCWHAVVGEMLSFIADMVTVRGMEAITANGYEVVREMLERPRRTS
jgi:hypothetical protein